MSSRRQLLAVLTLAALSGLTTKETTNIPVCRTDEIKARWRNVSVFQQDSDVPGGRGRFVEEDR